jgi:hypothetical protein
MPPTVPAAAPAAAPIALQLAASRAVFPSDALGEMEDSSPLLALDDGGAALRARFAADG